MMDDFEEYAAFIKKAVGVVLVEDAELLERLRSSDEEEEVRE